MDDLLERLARSEKSSFPRFEPVYRQLVSEGQHPSTLFIDAQAWSSLRAPAGR